MTITKENMNAGGRCRQCSAPLVGNATCFCQRGYPTPMTAWTPYGALAYLPPPPMPHAHVTMNGHVASNMSFPQPWPGAGAPTLDAKGGPNAKMSNQDMDSPARTKRSTRKAVKYSEDNRASDEESDESEEDPRSTIAVVHPAMESLDHDGGPKIESVTGRRLHPLTLALEYQVKYWGKSHLQAEWLSRHAIENNPAHGFQNKTKLRKFILQLQNEDVETFETISELDDLVRVENILSQKIVTHDEGHTETASPDTMRALDGKPVSLSFLRAHEEETMTRLAAILARFEHDPDVSIFLHPVDLEEVPDYTDHVSEPMDLGTIRSRLDEKFYKGCEGIVQITEDIRMVFLNCMVYNEEGSEIWNTANTQLKLFNRLHREWIMNPAAWRASRSKDSKEENFVKPWVTGCSICGKSEEADKVILCDCCDAEYHIYCVAPPLEAVPEGTWLCPHCSARPEMKIVDVLRSLGVAGTAFNGKEAVYPRKMFLVKWEGRSYKDCTWEFESDLVGEEDAIKRFYRKVQPPPREVIRRTTCQKPCCAKAPFVTEDETYIEEANSRCEKRADCILTVDHPGKCSRIKKKYFAAMSQRKDVNRGDYVISRAMPRIRAQLSCFSYLANSQSVPVPVMADCGGEATALLWEVEERLKKQSESKGAITLKQETTQEPSVKQERKAIEASTSYQVKCCLASMVDTLVSGVKVPELDVEPVPMPVVEYTVNIYKDMQHGLGMSLAKTTNNMGLKVLSMHSLPDGSPSSVQMCGVVAKGDLVVGIGGVDVTALDFQVVIRRIKASVGHLLFTFRTHRPVSLFPPMCYPRVIEHPLYAVRTALPFFDSSPETIRLLDPSDRSGLSAFAEAPSDAQTDESSEEEGPYSSDSEAEVSRYGSEDEASDSNSETDDSSAYESESDDDMEDLGFYENLVKTATEQTIDPDDIDDRIQLVAGPEEPETSDDHCGGVVEERDGRRFVPYKTSPAYKQGRQLFTYQVEGLNWMLRGWYKGINMILADEMGLGKTVQVVSLLDHIYRKESIRGPFLVIVPLSTIQHWRREFERWTDLIVCLYHDGGSSRSRFRGGFMREFVRQHEWYFPFHRRSLTKFEVLLTTYETLATDIDEIAKFHWRFMVVDEGHRLKSHNSKLLSLLKGLQADHRLLLTGTPLQNNTRELWTLMNFLEPRRFSDMDDFEERFGQLETQEQVLELQGEIAPHILRRVKEDVEKDLPPKEETIIEVELTILQKRYYRAIFEKNRTYLSKGLKGSVPALLNIHMELRKCCNHPFLIHGAEEREISELGGDPTEEDRMAKIINCSGKFVLLDKLLPKLRKEGHKVLIFSQFVTLLDLLADYCEFRDFPSERLDGGVQGLDRQAAIDRFSDEKSNSFLFLLSTRAGGVGINLVAADTVIIFDSDWNPQNDLQAQARCHRIGQEKAVTIYRLLTRNTFETQIFERASKKLGLEQAGTVSLNNVTKNGDKMDAAEMEALLREGAYGLLDDDETASTNFVERDIEQILQENARVRVVDKPTSNKSGFNVGRTTFMATSGDDSVSIDDPDFWEKVLPEAINAEMLLVKLKDGSVIETNKGRNDFLRHLRSLTADILERRDRGDFVDPKELEDTSQVLRNVSVMKKHFVHTQLKMVNNLLEKLSATPMRSCRRVVEANAKKLKKKDASKSGRDRSRKRRRSAADAAKEYEEGSPERPWRGDENESTVRPSSKRVRPPLTHRKSRSERKNRRGHSEDECGAGEEDGEGAASRAVTPSVGPPAEPAARESEPPKDGEDYHVDVCVLCGVGGLILLCDGVCKRSFHTDCLQLKEPPSGRTWVCPDCQAGKHVCLICNTASRVDATRHAVYKCAKDSCGRFYHRKCAKQSDKVQWRSAKRAKEVVFECPQHLCAQCDESVHRRKLLKCLWCPKAFHHRCARGGGVGDGGGAGSDFTKVSKDMIICPDHDYVADVGAIEGRAEENEDEEEEEEEARTRESSMTFPEHRSERAVEGVSAAEASTLKKRRKVEKRSKDEEETDLSSGRPVSNERKKHLAQEEEQSTQSDKDVQEDTEPTTAVPSSRTRERKRPTRVATPSASLQEVSQEDVVDEERVCTLCSTIPESVRAASKRSLKQIEGEILPDQYTVRYASKRKEKVFVHRFCAEMSPEVYMDEDDHYRNIVSAVKRGRRSVCTFCRQRGATVGCFIKSCKENYHLLCGIHSGGALTGGPEGQGNILYCREHRELAEAPAGEELSGRKMRSKSKIQTTRTEKQVEDAPSERERRRETVAAPKETPRKHRWGGAAQCKKCARACEDSNAAIVCASCELRFHPTCVGLSNREARKQSEWLCQSCGERGRALPCASPLCRRRNSSKTNDLMVECSGCGVKYHATCARGRDKSAKSGEWMCGSCEVQEDRVDSSDRRARRSRRRSLARGHAEAEEDKKETGQLKEQEDALEGDSNESAVGSTDIRAQRGRRRSLARDLGNFQEEDGDDTDQARKHMEGNETKEAEGATTGGGNHEHVKEGEEADGKKTREDTVGRREDRNERARNERAKEEVSADEHEDDKKVQKTNGRDKGGHGGTKDSPNDSASNTASIHVPSPKFETARSVDDQSVKEEDSTTSKARTQLEGKVDTASHSAVVPRSQMSEEVFKDAEVIAKSQTPPIEEENVGVGTNVDKKLLKSEPAEKVAGDGDGTVAYSGKPEHGRVETVLEESKACSVEQTLVSETSTEGSHAAGPAVDVHNSIPQNPVEERPDEASVGNEKLVLGSASTSGSASSNAVSGVHRPSERSDSASRGSDVSDDSIGSGHDQSPSPRMAKTQSFADPSAKTSLICRGEESVPDIKVTQESQEGGGGVESSSTLLLLDPQSDHHKENVINNGEASGSHPQAADDAGESHKSSKETCRQSLTAPSVASDANGVQAAPQTNGNLAARNVIPERRKSLRRQSVRSVSQEQESSPQEGRTELRTIDKKEDIDETVDPRRSVRRKLNHERTDTEAALVAVLFKSTGEEELMRVKLKMGDK